MGIYLMNCSMVFAAGCVGGLANSLAVWFLGKTGISKALGLQIAPALTPSWLYPRIVWGGLWGFLFLLPYFQQPLLTRGIVWSLGPTLVVLFIVFPFQAKKGLLGLQLGMLTPLFAFAVNAVWGITAAWWLSISKILHAF